MVRRALLLIVWCGSAVALADPAAEKLFQDGRAALAANRLDEACELFRRSDAREPRFGAIANLADCEQRRGRIATAWAAFVDAEARARRAGDPRAAYAAKRHAALAPRLPYLTIAVAPALRAIGVTVRRNGAVVDAAEYDRKLPFDPGGYRIEAAAAGYASWQQDVKLVEGKETRVELPALAAGPPAPPIGEASPPLSVVAPRSATVAVTRDPPPAQAAIEAAAAPARPVPDHLAVGLVTGLSSDLDWIYGARVVWNAAAIGPGVLRAVPSVMRTSYTDKDDIYRIYTLYALSTTLEYAYPVTPRLIAAGGLGVGVDLESDNYGNSSNNSWGCARLSPTLRFDRFDIAAHLQLVWVSGRTVTLAELGVDLFLW
jgi:hypothetical protein